MLMIPPQAEDRQRERMVRLERDLVLPIKALMIAYIYFDLIDNDWYQDPRIFRDFIQIIFKSFFFLYVGLNVAAAGVILRARTIRINVLRATVSSTSILDASFAAGLIFLTNGFDSSLFWLFPALIVRNAISIPAAVPQFLLQAGTNFSYVLGGALDLWVTVNDLPVLGHAAMGLPDPNFVPLASAESFLLRLLLLVLLTLCCFAVQALLEKQHRVEAEGREFSLRSEQVRTAGRLAAEIAHQLKNPLGIISNTAWSLQRTLKNSNERATDQLQIIREEVNRSDRILTELMGYARLAEGQVEKLDVAEEIESAETEVFPPNAAFHDIKVEKRIDPHLPTLLMQRMHLHEIFVNLLINAREALGPTGHVRITAQQGDASSVVVTIEDDGPGIPQDRWEQVFEAYFSTRDKGTGLGLAIVRNNIELYGGTATIQSGLGKGARFVLRFPARTLLK